MARLSAAIRTNSLTDDEWRWFVDRARQHAVLTRWADELSGEPDMEQTVRLLRGHAALRQRRFQEAFSIFREANANAALCRSDRLSFAESCRAIGEHATAMAALSVEQDGAVDEELIFWQAVSALGLGHPVLASELLLRTARPYRRVSTEWLARYLAVSLRHSCDPCGASHAALADRYGAIAEGDSAELIFALLDYKSPDMEVASCNIGDYIQTAAMIRQLSRFASSEWSFADSQLSRIVQELSETWGESDRQAVRQHVHITVLDRDAMWPASTLYQRRTIWAILHGWYHQRSFGFGSPFPLPENLNALFLSIHIHDPQTLSKKTIALLRQHEPIGCRDWSTVYWLLNLGVEAFFSGCLTSTLSLAPPACGTDSAFYVDTFPPPESEAATEISHETEMTRNANFSGNIEGALRLLGAYASAAAVSTSRLHCYLPCRALGTPVTFTPHNAGNRRFDGLSDLDASSLEEMRSRLQEMLGSILPMILRGAEESAIRERWRCIAAPWTAEARERLKSSPRLFASEPTTTPQPLEQLSPAPMRRQPVTVVASFDRSYVRHVLPLVRSIRAHASTPVSFVFLVREVTREELEVPLGVAGRDTRVIPMDSFFEGTFVRLSGMTTMSTMDRLVLPQLLPDHDRVVYIDIDAVVLGDVADLEAFAPSRRGISARPNPAPQARYQVDAIEYVARSLDAHTSRSLRRLTAADVALFRPSFNAGVLVLSLDRLRALKFTDICLSIVERFGLQDEQTMNIFSQGDFAELPAAWNTMPYFDSPEGAKLIHWAGANKPWLGRPIRLAERWVQYGGTRDIVDEAAKAGYWGNREHHSSSWEERARRAAGLIAPGSSVLDLGCGRMYLRKFLPPGCRYVPADLPRWTAEVIAVDLNAGEFPHGEYDVVVLLNVLEYLSAPLSVIERAIAHGRQLVVSYCHPAPHSSIDARREALWINDFSECELVAAFRAAGWTTRSAHVYIQSPTEKQVIYVLDRP